MMFELRPKAGFPPIRILPVIVCSFIFAPFALPASAETCSEAIAHCKQDGSRHSDADSKCTAAGNACMKMGIFIGPYTRKVWRGFVKR
jgi:hypothetical protein